MNIPITVLVDITDEKKLREHRVICDFDPHDADVDRLLSMLMQCLFNSLVGIR